MVKHLFAGRSFSLASNALSNIASPFSAFTATLSVMLLLFSQGQSAPTPATITSQPNITAIKQLSDFQNAARPEYSAYLAAGLIYIPLPTQTQLKTEWGTHNGFAYRQNLALWLTNKFDGNSESKSGGKLTWGLAWFGERQGWDNEDFLFFPHRGDFSIHRQIHTLAATMADSSKGFLLGAGVQYLNHRSENICSPANGQSHCGNAAGQGENELRWHLLGTWKRFSTQYAFYKNEIRYINAQLNLQARELRGNKSSWQNYLPDLEFSLLKNTPRDDDSVKFFISQNIYAQKLYLEGNFYLKPQKFSNAAIKFYPEPSRLLLALEATVTQKLTNGSDNGEIFWGGGITLPFFRIAYNHSADYDYFFKARGVWVAEFRLGIGTSGDSFFALGAPKAAPSEVSKSSVKKTTVENEPQ